MLERSITIAAPVEEVFAFHLDTRNAAAIAPPEARVVRVEGEFPVREGALVGIWMRPAPLAPAQEWRVRVAEVDPPTRLVDVAERSPFAEWRHEHLFRPLGDGRTEMTDRVTYRPPLGPLGGLADRILVGRLLERTFRIRQERTRAALEGGP